MAEAAAKKEVPRDVKLTPAGLHMAEHQRNLWVVTAERGVTSDDLKNPGYWAHVASKLRPWDHVEVRAEDGTFFAQYIVLSCDRTWAKVHPILWLNLNSQDISLTQAEEILSGYEIKFRGPKKWSVIRKIDRGVLHEGLHEESDAKKWLNVYLSSQNVPSTV